LKISEPRHFSVDCSKVGAGETVIRAFMEANQAGPISMQMENQDLAALRSQIVTSTTGRGGRRTGPYAFTEQEVAVLSPVLNSPRATVVNNWICDRREGQQEQSGQGQVISAETFAVPPAPTFAEEAMLLPLSFLKSSIYGNANSIRPRPL
jgi:hypothetical protein